MDPCRYDDTADGSIGAAITHARLASLEERVGTLAEESRRQARKIRWLWVAVVVLGVALLVVAFAG